jgi:hypothetical protein
MSVKSTEIELPNATNLNCSGEVFAAYGYGTTNGNIVTTNGDIETTNGDITAGGNVVVTGTVDGRDVATDGTKLDTIATDATKNPYYHVTHNRLRGTYSTTFYPSSYGSLDMGQFTNVYDRSTPEPTTRIVDVALSITWGYSSTSNQAGVRIAVKVPSGSHTVTLGTVTEVPTNAGTTNTTGLEYDAAQTNEQWYYVSGDKTHYFTDFGRIGQYSSGSVEHTIRAAQYVPSTDRTYFCSTNNTSAMTTGELRGIQQDESSKTLTLKQPTHRLSLLTFYRQENIQAL